MKCSRHVLDDDDAGGVGGQRLRNTRSASVPPVEAPSTTTFSVVWNIAFRRRGAGRTASAVSFGCTMAAAAARSGRSRARGRRLDRVADPHPRFLEELLGTQARLVDDLDRPVLEGAQGGIRTLSR